MPDPLAYRRTHSLLLVQRLLSFRPGVSPLTVVLDSLEQSGKPVVRECIVRAKSSKVHVVFIAYETLKPFLGVDVLISGSRKDFASLQKEVTSAIGSSSATLIIIDTLHPLLRQPVPLPHILASLCTPTASLLATYHTDVPLTPRTLSANPYAPPPLELLKSFSTTLITPQSLHHAHAAHVASQCSLPAPAHGLAEGIDGVLVGLGANGGGRRLEDAPPGYGRGVVLEVEHRRKSGRGVFERVFLSMEASGQDGPSKGGGAGTTFQPADDKSKASLHSRHICLLDDHPSFKIHAPRGHDGDEGDAARASAAGDAPEGAATTFNLTLTERQRAERAGVVLPYYDAQREGAEGLAAGGRILYQMGIEDAGDWDSEEDEL